MSYKSQITSILHGGRGGAVAFLIALLLTLSLVSSTALAKIDNGAYLIAATNNSSNTTNKNTTSNKKKSADDYFKQGKAYYDSNEDNKYSKAVKEFTQAINNENNNDKKADYYLWRAWAHYHIGKDDYDDAEKDFTQAINLKPNYASAYGGRAWVYKAVNKPEKAKIDFLKAANEYLNQDPKDYSTAKADFEHALEIDENCAEAIFRLAGIAIDIDKNYTQAIELYTRLIDELGNPYEPSYTYANRALAYYNIKEFDKAITDFESAAGKDPAYMYAYKRLANIYFDDKKDYLNALDNYKTVLELDETQEKLSDSEKQTFQKNIDICWASLNPAEKLMMIARHPSLMGEIHVLLKALAIVMALEFILAIAYEVKSRNLTLGFVVKKVLQIAIFCTIIFVVDSIDESDVVAYDFRNILIVVLLLCEVVLILDDAGNLGVPIPNDIKNIIRGIIDKIKGIFRIP